MPSNRGNGSRKLTEEQQAFVVQRLACYDSPLEAARALKAEFDVSLTPQGAEAYDPNKRQGQRLRESLRELFARTRAQFHARLEDIPEANKAVRVKRLAHAARALHAAGNLMGEATILEHIAKEMGNVHTNRREHTGANGGPIAFTDLTDEQLDARLERALQAAGLAPPVPTEEHDGRPH